MREENKPEASGTTSRAWIVGLGVLSALGILAVSAVFIVTRIGASAESARAPQRAPVSTTPIPQSTLPTVAAAPTRIQPLKARVLFGVQSVGKDIAKSIPAAHSAAHVDKPQVTTWNKAKNSKKPVIATATIGRNGNPASKLRAFAALVNDAPRGSIDVAVMAFNYQDVNAETDVDGLFDDYQETMESIEVANPDITFVYTTVPVTASNSWRAVDRANVTGLHDVTQPVWQDNIARERLNMSIRERYGNTGRLFDIAALQARVNSTKVAAKTHEGQWYYVMNPVLSGDGKGLNKKGATQLAKELMLLVAAADRT